VGFKEQNGEGTGTGLGLGTRAPNTVGEPAGGVPDHSFARMRHQFLIAMVVASIFQPSTTSSRGSLEVFLLR
jgi:hypothetical protein